jgi:hypothetical protein
MTEFPPAPDQKSVRSPDDLELHRAPLVRGEALEWIVRALPDVPNEGAREVLASIVEAARAALPLANQCLEEVDCVFQGKLAAANRLWFLLRSVAGESHASIPGSILRDIAGGRFTDEPRTIRADRLIDLVFGTVRAANTPAEADSMLEALDRLVEPLFLLEFAICAVEDAARGRTSPLRSLVAAGGSLRPPLGPPAQNTSSTTLTDIWVERRPFAVEAWHSNVVGTSLDKWTEWGCAPRWASQLNKLDPQYQIESISNPKACPGEQLKIYGKNFGPSGRVQFQPPDWDDPMYPTGDLEPLRGVEPVTWTDTEIAVVVPPWARSGELHLAAFRRVEERCLIKDVYRLGNSVLFKGGLPYVYELKVNSRGENAWVSPNAAATIEWVTSSSGVGNQWWYEAGTRPGNVTIDIRNDEDPAAPHWRVESLPDGSGSVQWAAPAVSKPTRFVVALSVGNQCGSAARELPFLVAQQPQVKILGIEITQAIQHFDLFAEAWNNSVPLVARKETVARAYIDSGLTGGFDYGSGPDLLPVTGTLRVWNETGPITALSPVTPDATKIFSARPEATIERENGFHTLNFRIPWHQVIGTVTLEMEARAREAIAGFV